MSGPAKDQWIKDPGKGPFLGTFGDDFMLVTGGRAAGGGGDDWLTTGPGVPHANLYGDNDPKTPESEYEAPGDDVLNGGRGVKEMHSGGQDNDGDGEGDAYWIHGKVGAKDAIKAKWADYFGGDYFILDNSDKSEGEGTGITVHRIKGEEVDTDGNGDADTFIFDSALIRAHSVNPAVKVQNVIVGFNDDGYGNHREVEIAIVSGDAKESVREWIQAGVSDGTPDANDWIL